VISSLTEPRSPQAPALSFGRRVAWILAALVLFSTGAVGLFNSYAEWGDARTGLQRLVQIGVAVYGVFGVLAAVALVRRRPISVGLTLVWGLGATCAGTVASFAYSDPTFSREETVAGTMGALFGSLIIVALVVWAARVATRPQNLPHTADGDHIPSS